jgi:hypothetical protein
MTAPTLDYSTVLTKIELAAESVVSPEMRDAILDRFPSKRGATVADLLDMAYDADWGIEHTDPAWDTFGKAVSEIVAGTHDLDRRTAHGCTSIAMLTLALAHETPLAEDRVRDLAGSIAARLKGEA